MNTTDPNEKHIAKPAYGQKPNCLDGHDHAFCANKVRKESYRAPNGFDADGRMTFMEVADTSSLDCKHNKLRLDPACAAENCPRIGVNDAALD